MERSVPITCVFLDIGGVLLTDGWDNHARKRAAEKFKLELNDFESRHRMNFEIYEEGDITLDEYFDRVVFNEKRSFTRGQFQDFMFAQSQAYPEVIELITELKVQYGLKIAVLSNEGREVNAYRILKFKLRTFVDFFVSSCFIHIRKPDERIFKLALDIAQVPIGQIIYIEDTPLFVQIAEGLGIQSILHTDYKSTRAKLAALGLRDKKITHEAV